MFRNLLYRVHCNLFVVYYIDYFVVNYIDYFVVYRLRNRLVVCSKDYFQKTIKFKVFQRSSKNHPKFSLETQMFKNFKEFSKNKETEKSHMI